MKVCSKCGGAKSAEEFSRDVRSSDGLQPQCKACKAEGARLRHAANPGVARAYAKTWRQANLEEARARDVARYAANPEKVKARVQRWTEMNRERKASTDSAWKKANRDKANANAARREAQKLQATPVWANADHIAGMYEVAQLFRNIGIDMHVDHIVPLCSSKVCGLHVEFNMQLLVKSENSVKGNRWWPDMAK